MGVKERILAITLVNKASKNPNFMKEIGIKAEMISKTEQKTNKER